jgi:hypothetical protein
VGSTCLLCKYTICLMVIVDCGFRIVGFCRVSAMLLCTAYCLLLLPSYFVAVSRRFINLANNDQQHHFEIITSYIPLFLFMMSILR